MAVLFAVTGCSSEARTTDAPGTAVRETRSAIAGLTLAVELVLDGRVTVPLAQVTLDQTLDAVAGAQQELITATDADPRRRAEASDVVGRAAGVLVGFGDRGAGDLTDADWKALQQVEGELASAAKDLRA